MENSILHTRFKKYVRHYFIILCIVIFNSTLISISLALLFKIDIYIYILLFLSSTPIGILLAYLKRPSIKDWVNTLHIRNPKAEYSLELFFVTSELVGLQNLQKKKIENIFSELDFPQVPVAIGLFTAFWVILVPVVLHSITRNEKHPGFSNNITICCDYPIADSVQVSLKKKTVFPPRYSRLPIDSLNDDLPLQGSRVVWVFDIKGPLKNVWAETIQGDSIPLQREKGNWLLQHRITSPFYFSLVWLTTNGKTGYSSEWSQKIRWDNSPIIYIDREKTYERLKYQSDQSIEINITAEDDFGLNEIFAVATVATGSGEAIQFREKKIPLLTKKSSNKEKIRWKISLDSMGLKPGSELYFYVAALDNKFPTPQKKQSPTYFIVLEDTSDIEFSLAGGLGVDILPDYFRSQLQIILDTEKLLQVKSKIKKEEFNKMSNELGFDQKQLRLLYGQFIGEEEDSGLEIDHEEPEHNDPTDTQEEIIEEYGHTHDHENEHALEEAKDEDPLRPYLHTHDDEEVATFLEVSMKTKLKAALTEMWDAELYLRLYQPSSSLPYQRRALELLNEIRNHARIYVLRMGFDPPAIAEAEHRLKKEMENGALSPLLLSGKNEWSLIPLKNLLFTYQPNFNDKLSSTELFLLKDAALSCAQHFSHNPQLDVSLIQLLKSAEKKEKIEKHDWNKIVRLSQEWLGEKIEVGGYKITPSDTLTSWFVHNKLSKK